MCKEELWFPVASTHILSFRLVQNVSFLPLAVSALIGLADVKVNLGSLLVLHGLPLIQSHLLGPFLFDLAGLVFPGNDTSQMVRNYTGGDIDNRAPH